MNEQRRQESLVKKMQTNPLEIKQPRTSYDAFVEFADDLKKDLDHTVEYNRELSERLWNA